MIHIVIFSKDRACQLDLTLSTFKKYFKEWNQQKVSIIYTSSNQEYHFGYDRVRQLHPEFNYVEQFMGFYADTREVINKGGMPYISFIVDDDVFIDYFSINDPEMQRFMSDPNILCISPRLAPYINFCYTQNQPQPQPHLNPDRTWNWNGAIHDWQYPMSIASMHVFRSEDIIPLINNFPFPTPSHLEGVCLDSHRPNRPLMICYEHAKCICSTNNKVQMVNNNRHDNLNSLHDLNMSFFRGLRLDPDANHQYTLNMCHGPLKYHWR